jgi:hypothetical protein
MKHSIIDAFGFAGSIFIEREKGTGGIITLEPKFLWRLPFLKLLLSETLCLNRCVLLYPDTRDCLGGPSE